MPESLSFRFEAVDAGVLKALTAFDTALERIVKAMDGIDTAAGGAFTDVDRVVTQTAQSTDRFGTAVAQLATGLTQAGGSLSQVASAATGFGTALAATTPPAAAFNMELARARDLADQNARALEAAAAATTGLGTAAAAVVPVVHTSNAAIVGGAVQAASGLALSWKNGVATISENYAALPARLQPANDAIVAGAEETAPKVVPPWQAAHERVMGIYDASLALLQSSGDRVLQSVGDTADEIARRATRAADEIAAKAREEVEKLDKMRNFVETQLGPAPDMPFVRFAGDLDGLLKQQAEYIQKMRGLGESTRMISMHSTGYFQSQMEVLHKILADIGARINAIQGVENPALLKLPRWEFGDPRDPSGRLLDPPGFAAGGLVPGSGPADSVLARVSPGEFLLPPREVGSLMDMLSQALRPLPEARVSPGEFLLPPREVLSLAPAVDLPARQVATSMGGRGRPASTSPGSTSGGSGGGGSVVHHHHPPIAVTINYTGVMNPRMLVRDIRDELLEAKRRGEI